MTSRPGTLNNEEFEKAILGCCMRFPDNIPFVIDRLIGDDFSSHKHRAIFNSIKSLYRRKAPTDHLSLLAELKGQKWEISCSELIELEDFFFEGQNITYYIDQIKIQSTKRRLQTFLSESLKKIPELDYSELGTINQRIEEILSTGKPFQADFVKSASVFFEEVRELFDHSEVNRGIKTGWKSFDDLLGGLRLNELTELTGETGSGKSTFATNLSYKLARVNHPVLICTFEMKPVAILRKILQMESGRPISSHTLQSVSPFSVSVSSMPIFFLDRYGEIGLSQLKKAIFYARRRCRVEFVILDHLHFFLKYSGDHERQAIDSALRDIKSWAMELGIHIILIVHPTKLETENRPIRLNDLKGSSGLKQTPDNVLSLWRPRDPDDLKHPQNEIVLHILKCRDDAGDEGKVILTFDKRSQSYSDSGPGLARPAEGERTPASSPSSRTPQGRDWISGYDQ
jgi:replicative DNA helicase